MPYQNLRLVAELTPQEETELVALEASIRNIHLLATVDAENAKRAAKSIRSIRMEAQRGLDALRSLRPCELNACERRGYLVQFEIYTRTLAAVNKVQPARPI